MIQLVVEKQIHRIHRIERLLLVRAFVVRCDWRVQIVVATVERLTKVLLITAIVRIRRLKIVAIQVRVVVLQVLVAAVLVIVGLHSIRYEFVHRIVGLENVIIRI